MRIIPFKNRKQAGIALAARLKDYTNQPDVLILALPRGGVPVAYPVSQALNAPLDIIVARKLGLPGQKELAIGAIASGGIRVVNEDLVADLGLSEEIIEKVARAEQQELVRREHRYRGDRPPPAVNGKTVILIDDGLATGTTMRAALVAIKKQAPRRVVIAVPVAPYQTVQEFSLMGDEIVCVMTPEPFHAIGLWYQEFFQVADEEVCHLLEEAAARHPLSDQTIKKTTVMSKQEVNRMNTDKPQDWTGNTDNGEQNLQDKRESGLPGGGMGRKDEIGHTGIYPMSGPPSPDDVVVRTPAEWGQGERGAEGYFDHGESGITGIQPEEAETPPPTKPKPQPD